MNLWHGRLMGLRLTKTGQVALARKSKRSTVDAFATRG